LESFPWTTNFTLAISDPTALSTYMAWSPVIFEGFDVEFLEVTFPHDDLCTAAIDSAADAAIIARGFN
jgi:hypothetical protein